MLPPAVLLQPEMRAQKTSPGDVRTILVEVESASRRASAIAAVADTIYFRVFQGGGAYRHSRDRSHIGDLDRALALYMRALDLLAMASSRVHQARNTVKGFGKPTMLINLCAMVDSMYRTYLPRAEKTYVSTVGERVGVRGGAVVEERMEEVVEEVDEGVGG